MKHMIISVLLLAGVIATNADTYQFIISGYPAENESYSVPSTTTSLETASRTAKSVATSIEARYRTWEESSGIALRSDEYLSMMILIR